MSAQHFTVSRGGFRPYTSKHDALRSAKRFYVCRGCDHWHREKVKVCERCGSREIRHFASRAEATRYAHLRLLEDAGDITQLRCQPRFPCKVNGVLVATYVGDFAYRKGGLEVIEDVKGNKDFQDSASKLRRKLAEVIYGINVKLVEA